MSRLLPSVLAWLAIGLSGAITAEEPPAKTAWPDVEITPEMKELLRRIEQAGPYAVPDLGLRRVDNYADTPGSYEPFGGVRPFKEHFLEQIEYTGPGRAVPEPGKLDSVKLGFIGPIEATVSAATGGRSRDEALGIQMLRGSRLAVEEANARGGYTARGIPFELVVRNDNGLWGASGNTIVDLAYKDRVWAILGTIDGANSHIGIRVALKAEVLMLNTGDTDPTFVETNIPWTARVIGDDRQQGYLLVDYLYRKLGLERVGIIRASNRYGRFGVREIRDGSRRLGRPIVLEMAYEVDGNDYSLQLERLQSAGVDGIVHWGDAEDGARILNQMRAMGMEQPFFASDRAVDQRFVEIAGDHAEGVVCGFPWNPERDDARLSLFRENFRRRFDEEPDTFAAHAYDGMNMLIWATQVAGLNRARIRDVIAHMPRWPGVTGEIVFSAVLDDVGQVYLARYEKGRWHYLSREELEIPGDEPGAGAAAAGEVRIGWFGPSDPEDPDGGDLWSAVSIAVERENARGGFGGIPFRLAPAWSADPWGTGIARLAEVVFRQRAWAVIGSIDGAATHLAEQLAVKAQLALVSPAGTDETVNLAGVPWMFSCLPPDRRHAELLRDRLSEGGVDARYTLISATDHDSRETARVLSGRLGRDGLGPERHLQFDPRTDDPGRLAGSAIAAGSPTAVVIASAADSARLVRELRTRRPDLTILGGPSMGRRAFLEQAGEHAEGAIFPDPCAASPGDDDFTREFLRRTGHPPDCVAIQAYDATRVVVAAIRRAGLDRAAIRDALRDLSPWSGHAGVIDWDSRGRNLRPGGMATYRDRRLVPL